MTERNRRSWNRESDAYQAKHGERLIETAMAWGVWRIPESELDILGDLQGKSVLELGCGAAQWSIALAGRGVTITGVDLSDRQLHHASEAVGASGSSVDLVQGDAEALPFRDASFDVVFCDHGATVFAPSERVIPEAARVLRPNGLLAFCMSSPLRDICWNVERDRIGRQLELNYFGLRAIDDGEDTCFQLPYGEWIRLFRGSGLEVDDLVELQAPRGGTTTYAEYVPLSWARRWPGENIWKARKRPG